MNSKDLVLSEEIDEFKEEFAEEIENTRKIFKLLQKKIMAIHSDAMKVRN